MDRRKFLQSLALLGASAAPTVFAFTGETLRPSELGQALVAPEAEKEFEPVHTGLEGYRLGVVAVGGAGGAILSGLHGQLPHLDRSIAIDLDPFALHRCIADQKILVGEGRNRRVALKTTKQLAQAMKPQIAEAVAGLDAVLIVAGMGGNAGTCLSPLVAEILHEKNIMTLGAAITPFEFEGMRRNGIAGIGLQRLGREVNALVPISHQALSTTAGDDAHFSPLLAQSQSVVGKLYGSLSISLGEQGLIGTDLLDVQNAVTHGGYSALGFGSSSGFGAAENAALNAIKYPLLGLDRLRSAQGVLVAIEGSPARLKSQEINKVFEIISADAQPRTTVIFSAMPNPASVDSCHVTVLASGIRHL